MRHTYLVFGIIIGVLVLLFVTFHFLPAKYTIKVLGQDNILSRTACIYPVKVAGDSMGPDFYSGQLVLFDRCVKEGDLSVDKVIAFQDNGVTRLGKIADLENIDNQAMYKVIQPNRQDRSFSVSFGQVLAIYKN